MSVLCQPWVVALFTSGQKKKVSYCFFEANQSVTDWSKRAAINLMRLLHRFGLSLILPEDDLSVRILKVQRVIAAVVSRIQTQPFFTAL